MAKIYINESTLTDIGNAIRGKEKTTASIPVNDMATRITNLPSGGVQVPSNWKISDTAAYSFGHGVWDWFIEAYGSNIVTNKLKDARGMFRKSTVSNIPFKLNFSGSSDNISGLFFGATNLTSIPNISSCWPTDMGYMFQDCYNLRTIPDNLFESAITSMFCNAASHMFAGCYSLRQLPNISSFEWLQDTTYSESYFYQGFPTCYVLDEILNLPVPYSSTWTSNAFSLTFMNCSRVKNITFDAESSKSWKNQTIDLSSYVGYANYGSHILSYNSGITSDKEVKDATTYAALKNDPDWYTLDPAYSRYNKTSALATINSLPSTSGSNTIKFKGSAGSKTDGGAISSLTSSQIAIATAKGWTVSFV